MKKKFVLAAAAALFTLGTAGQCFADTAAVPVHISVAETTVSFSVTEKIAMTAEAGSPKLKIDSLVIQNTGTMGQIHLDSLTVTCENGWSLVKNDSDFINMNANAKKFSLTSDDADFSEESTVYPGTAAKVGETITVTFSGKTGAATEAVQDLQIARIVASVSLV